MSDQIVDMLEAVQRPQVARLQAENAQLRADLADATRRADAMGVENAELRRSVQWVVGFMEDAPELWGNPAADTAIARLRALGLAAGGEQP